MSLATLIGAREPIRPPGPGDMLGLEYEFEVFDGDQQVDFRTLVHDVAARHGGGRWRAGPVGYFLEDGPLLISDGWEAEIATPPVLTTTAAAAQLRGLASHHTLLLEELVASVNRTSERSLRLSGYSTHLSALSTAVDLEAVCTAYASTVAPAMMLLTDLADSPGLLVRPRRRRFEVGCDFVVADEHLQSVIVFFLGGFLAVCDAVHRGAVERTLIPLATTRLERAAQRRGLFVPRDAFGDDLYSSGRQAMLQTADGRRLRAQDVLERCWEVARPFVADLASDEDLRRVDQVVGGGGQLPLESRDQAERRRPRGRAWSGSRGQLANAFYGSLRPLDLDDCKLDPCVVTWDFIVYRARTPHGESFLTLPRRHWGLLEEPGAASRIAAALLRHAAGPKRGGPTVAEDGDDLRIDDAIDEEALAGRFDSAKSDKKKKKKDPEDHCDVILLEEESEGSPPTVEICLPATRDPLRLRSGHKQEPAQNSAMCARSVYLHSGSFHTVQQDLRTRAVGFDLEITRSYKSAIDYDAILGDWELNYNKRVVPTPGERHRGTDFGWCEIYEGPTGPRGGSVAYYDGLGRVTQHGFLRWEHRTVRRCGPQGLAQFKAVVTTYAQNPGEEFEIERYAVYEGLSPWGDPIFYIWRHKDGSEQIFNCWGYVIAVRDEHLNTMSFRYGLPFNPQTGYLVLRGITDTSGRSYSVEWTQVAGALRIARISAPDGRAVRYAYNPRGELVEVSCPPGRHGDHRRRYEYGGRKGLLVRLHEAEQVASGGPPLIVNDYNPEERVVRQQEGPHRRTLTYAGETVASLKEPGGVTTLYKLSPMHDSYVVSEIRLRHGFTPNVPGVPFSPPSEYVTRYEYNADFLITKATYPDGRVDLLEFETTNAPVTSGDQFDWLELGVSFLNNLSRGNLLRKTSVSRNPQEPSVVQTWEYEHRFNRVTRMVGPLGTTTYEYPVPSCASPGGNGSPTRIAHPPLLQPDGTRRPHEQRFEYTPKGLIERFEDGDHVVTTYQYDPSGAISAMVIDPAGLGLSSRYVIDERGNTVKATDARGFTRSFVFDDRDNVIQTVDELGHVTRHFHDRNDNLVRIEELIADDPAGFPYPSGGFSGVSVLELRYDVLDQVVSRVVDPGGLALTTSFEYDAAGNVSVERRPAPGDVTRYEYDPRGLLHRVTDAPGTPAERSAYYLCDEGGRVVEALTPIGGRWSFVYDGHGYQVESLSPMGTRTKIRRDRAGRPSYIQVLGHLRGPNPGRSSPGQTLLRGVILVHDAMSRVVQEVALRFDPTAGFAGGVSRARTSYFRRVDGKVEEIADAENRRTSHAYDGAGRLIKTTLPGGHTVEYRLDAGGNIVEETVTEQPEGSFFFTAPAAIHRTTLSSFDALGRLTQEDSDLTGRTQFGYDSRGLLRAVLVATGSRETFEYDAAGRKTRQVQTLDPTPEIPSGEIVVATSPDRAGRPLEVTDGLGRKTIYEYDPLGRATRVTDPDNRSSRAGFDAEGRPVWIVDRASRRIEISYDLDGRPLRKVHVNPAAAAVEQRSQYDGVGNLTRVEDQHGQVVHVTERFHDSMGMLLKESQDGTDILWDYDLTGRVTEMAYPSGMRVSFDHTVSGKVDSLARMNGAVLAQYSYLGNRNVERIVPSVLHDPGSGSHYQFPLVRLNSYDARGRLESFAHYYWDDVTDPSNPLAYFLLRPLRLTYDPFGRIERKRSPDYGISYSYDKANRLTRTIADPIYDRLGIRREVINSRFDAGHNLSRQERVIIETLGGQQASVTTYTPNVLNATAQSVTVAGGNSQTRSFTYDQSGSLREVPYELTSKRFGRVRFKGKRQLFYDGFGRLSMVFLESADPARSNWRITYEYDGSGRRVLRVQQEVYGPGNTVLDQVMTRYVFWGDRCIEEWERGDASQPWRPARRYYHGQAQGELLAMDVREDELVEDVNNDGQIAGGVTLVFANDHEQTPMALLRLEYTGTRLPLVYERYLTDSAGNTDRFWIDGASGDPRFVERSVTGHTVSQHGRWFHEIEGLYYNGRRFYDPETSSFVERDPGGPWGDVASLGNGYAYAGNNAANFVDPTGQVAESVWDAASLGLGVYSISQWDENTSTADKALDVLGVVVDAAALALPFIPGGVGAGLKAYRAARTIAGAKQVYKAYDSAHDAYQAMKLGKQIERGLNAAQAIDGGLNATNAFNTYLETGSALSASFALLGGVGALRSARAAYQGICFTPGTEVATPRGFVAIECLREGDEVLSRDELTGLVLPRRVLRVSRRVTSELTEVAIVNRLGHASVIEATAEHPFLVRGSVTWRPAGTLVPDQILETADGGACVTAVRRRVLARPVEVLNLEVSGTHTFLVSRAAVVVHNTCAFENALPVVERHIAGAGEKVRSAAASLRRWNNAVTTGSNTPIKFDELLGIDFTVRRVRALGYELVGAVKNKGNQGIDLIFEGTGANAGKYALAEAKASRGLSALKTDTLGIRQGSLDFFLTRLERAGPEWSHVHALLKSGSGQVELFGGFAGGLVRGKAKLAAGNFNQGKLYRFDPNHFRTGVFQSFRKTPGAAVIVP